MKFRMNVYLDNLWKPIEYQGYRSKVKVTWVFFVFSVCDTYHWGSTSLWETLDNLVLDENNDEFVMILQLGL